MKLAMIVAASENNIIGSNGDLPWTISADLKRFRKLTMTHHMIMGRKTFESIGGLLPGRTTVIVTRQKDYIAPAEALVVGSVEEAIKVCEGDDQPFVIGGAQVYELFMNHVSVLHLTRVHATIHGDTVLSSINWDDWQLIESTRHAADTRNEHDYSFEVYERELVSSTLPGDLG